MISVAFPQSFVLSSWARDTVCPEQECTVPCQEERAYFPEFSSTCLTDTAREWETGWNRFNRVQGNG